MNPTCMCLGADVPRPRRSTAGAGSQVADAYAPDLPEEAATFDDSAWAAVDVNAGAEPLHNRESGAFRARFNVTSADLAAEAVELRFGQINGDASI